MPEVADAQREVLQVARPSVQVSRGRAPGTPLALVAALQRSAGNRAVTAVLANRSSSPLQSALRVQRCGPGGCAGDCANEEESAPPVQRRVDPALGAALDNGRFPGTPAAAPPSLSVVEIFERMPAVDQRDTVRALNPAQQLSWVQFCLNRRDDTTWHVIIETVSTSTRTYAVRALMSANRMNEPRGPWGAYGVLNGLSDTDQLAVLNQLVEPERRRLQQSLGSAPIDRLRLERQLAAVDPDAVPPVRQVTFPLTWVATELPPRAVTALGPAAYMGSQGAHAVAPTSGAAGMRMIGTDYWRALVPARRALELERVLNQLPRDLGTHFQSRMAATPPGQAPQFPWVSGQVGAMSRPFTVAELQSIPALVAKFNANSASLSAAEQTLLSRVVSLHVGGAHQGGSPLSSWSVPTRPGEAPPVTWSNSRQFRVRADFQRRAVLDNVNASAANTLNPIDAASFEHGVNPEEAEFLATAESRARVLTVEPITGAARGELVAGSTAWMARNATPIRWVGRGAIVVSFAISGYRIATADEASRARVVGEEAGAQAFGFGGALLAGAACVGLGIATGGVGLVLCGMAGGLLGGMAGSALGGAAVDSMNRPVAQNDPFNLMGGQPAAAGPGARDEPSWLVSTSTPEILNY
jgi:hypothetical protein